MSLVFDAHGRPYSKAGPDFCPSCGEGRNRREAILALGGRWKVLCTHCGYEFQRGIGDPPDPSALDEE